MIDCLQYTDFPENWNCFNNLQRVAPGTLFKLEHVFCPVLKVYAIWAIHIYRFDVLLL